MKVNNVIEAKQNPAYLRALQQWLFQLADDELTIGHRDSEWLGLCPDIEGDVAFSSIAQDEVGHALFYFDLLYELGDKTPDELAFERDTSKRRNAVILERENGDWAYSVVRHYFYDVFEQIRLAMMKDSSYLPLARGVAKILREEHYHLLYMEIWFQRLATAGGEATERIHKAIQQLWPELDGLFQMGEYQQKLLEYGIVSCNSSQLRDQWMTRMQTTFAQVGLHWPGELPGGAFNGRQGEHSKDLTQLLSNLSEVYNLYPAARW